METQKTFEDAMSTINKMQVTEGLLFDAHGNSIPGHKLISRDYEDKSPITITSSNYNVLQHKDAWNAAIETVDSYGLNYEFNYLKVNDYKKNNSVEISFKFPELQFDIDGSPTTATMNFFNSTDGRLAFKMFFGAYRLVCSNGLVIGEILYSVTKKHTKNFDVQQIQIGNILEKFKTEFSGAREMIEKSQNIRASKAFLEMLLKTFPAKVVMKLPEVYEKYQDTYKETITNYENVWAYIAVLSNWVTNYVANKNILRAYQMNRALLNAAKQTVYGI